MKVFLSWAGENSKQAAEELKQWLQSVIQALQPWFSPEDIEKGARWSPEIAKELSVSKAGIVCVTPDNQYSQWLNFEAGAISNQAGATSVCTLVIGMKPTDIKGPLSQFQATIVDRTDARRLVGTLNRFLDKDGLSESTLDRAFEAFWPAFETKLKAIEGRIAANLPSSPLRSERDMIEEILGLVREQANDRFNFANANRSIQGYLYQPVANYEEFPNISVQRGFGDAFQVTTGNWRVGESSRFVGLPIPSKAFEKAEVAVSDSGQSSSDPEKKG